jgi:hypothetical protein
MAINMAIWIWALVWTMKYWKVLPGWAQALSIIGLLGVVGGPIMTLIVVYIGKNANGTEKVLNSNLVDVVLGKFILSQKNVKKID